LAHIFVTVLTHVRLFYLFPHRLISFFFFNHPATPEIYTLSLHDALPICRLCDALGDARGRPGAAATAAAAGGIAATLNAPIICRSEEHTSELQSRSDLVCRLLLEKKKKLHRLMTRMIVLMTH